MKNCLLIFPLTFYSFSDYIRKNLESRGYQVDVINDEYPNNMFGKILGKLHIPLSPYITEKVIYKQKLKNNNYDLVLIFKGRGMSKSLIKKLKTASIKVVGYNFDSFKYHSHPLSWFKEVTNYYTFDYKDGKKHTIPIVELFSSLPQNNSKKITEYSISAIVRNHSDRINFIDKILNQLNEKKVFIYIFEKDFFTFIINFFRNPLLYIKYKKFIFFKPLPYDKYVDVLKKSNFTIDYAHPKQSGATVRCFEALSCQTKIITNNHNIKNNLKFGDNNVIVYSKDVSADIMMKKYKKIIDIIPEKFNRSIDDFINDLIK
ncbi:hypothetical protein [Polaribacter vadi]|uniref:hypothetical protein n=1 Tax=Polaribacter vadi TaxID=1774273 RepID=UPI0030EBD27E|tara:strand:+ start:19666 stop:20616 length:951 start_codon:yes stop_codon:yes gene_type:complete